MTGFLKGKDPVEKNKLLIIVVLVLIFGVSVILISISERHYIEMETQKVGITRLILSRAGARRLLSFFRRGQSSMTTLSYEENAFSCEKTEDPCLMRVSMQNYENTPLVGFIRFDAQGKAVVSMDHETTRIRSEVDVSDRNYFLWVKNQKTSDEAYLSKPIISRGSLSFSGRKIVSVVTPVFKNDVFDGGVAGAVDLERLVSEYIRDVAYYQETNAFVFDEEGTILLQAFPGEASLTGKNLTEILNGKKPQVLGESTPQEILQQIVSGEDGWLTIPDGTIFGAPSQKVILGYAPLEFGGKRWFFVSTILENEAFEGFRAYRQILGGSLLIAGLCIVIVGFLSLYTMRVAESEWYKRGYNHGKDSRSN